MGMMSCMRTTGTVPCGTSVHREPSLRTFLIVPKVGVLVVTLIIIQELMLLGIAGLAGVVTTVTYARACRNHQLLYGDCYLFCHRSDIFLSFHVFPFYFIMTFFPFLI